MQAEGDHQVTTEAKNGAKADTGIGAAVAVTISESDTKARIGTGGILNASNNFIVKVPGSRIQSFFPGFVRQNTNNQLC